MLDRLPQHFDYIRYTEARNKLKGEIALSSCTRLVELVSPEMGLMTNKTSPKLDQNIYLELQFGVDEVANRFVTGSVITTLLLTCQRCMQPVTFKVEIDLALAFIKKRDDEADIAGMYDSFYIENSDPIDLYALVEDEIILSLPLIAKHERTTDGSEQCVAVQSVDKEPDEIDIAYTEAQKQGKVENPFAVLKQIKE